MQNFRKTCGWSLQCVEWVSLKGHTHLDLKHQMKHTSNIMSMTNGAQSWTQLNPTPMYTMSAVSNSSPLKGWHM